MYVLGCILWEGCIPVSKNGRLGMHFVGRIHPCEQEQSVRDESGRKKSSLRKKRASWG